MTQDKPKDNEIRIATSRGYVLMKPDEKGLVTVYRPTVKGDAPGSEPVAVAPKNAANWLDHQGAYATKAEAEAAATKAVEKVKREKAKAEHRAKLKAEKEAAAKKRDAGSGNAPAAITTGTGTAKAATPKG